MKKQAAKKTKPKPRKRDGWGGAGMTLAEEIADRKRYFRSLTREELEHLLELGERDCARLDRKKRKAA